MTDLAAESNPRSQSLELIMQHPPAAGIGVAVAGGEGKNKGDRRAFGDEILVTRQLDQVSQERLDGAREEEMLGVDSKVVT